MSDYLTPADGVAALCAFIDQADVPPYEHTVAVLTARRSLTEVAAGRSRVRPVQPTPLHGAPANSPARHRIDLTHADGADEAVFGPPVNGRTQHH